MSLFITIIALLMILVLASLLWPLLRATQLSTTPENAQQIKAIYHQQLTELTYDHQHGMIDEQEYLKAKREIERRMLDELTIDNDVTLPSQPDRQLAWILAISLPIIAVLLYLQFGNYQVIAKPETLSQKTSNHEQQALMSQVDKMVASLENKLAQQPQNPQGWALLAKSYTELERYQQAIVAYEQAVAQNPNNANILADYADVLALINQHDLSGKPAQLVNQALSINPNHLKALMLATTIAFNQQDYASAVDYLQRLDMHLPADSPIRANIKKSLQSAQQQLSNNQLSSE